MARSPCMDGVLPSLNWLVGCVLGLAVWTAHGQSDRSASGQIPAVLTNVAMVRNLTAAAASESFPIDATGVVTWMDQSKVGFFFEDSSGSIWVECPQGVQFQAGQGLRLKGHSLRGLFTPVIGLTETTPAPVPALAQPPSVSGRQMLGGQWDAQRVKVAGRLFPLIQEDGSPEWRLVTEGVSFRLFTPNYSPPPSGFVMGEQVEVMGISTVAMDGDVIVDLRLMLSSWGAIQRDATRALAGKPPKPITLATLKNALPAERSDDLVLVEGVVTWKLPQEKEYYVQDSTGGIVVRGTNSPLFTAGTVLELTGICLRQQRGWEFHALAAKAKGSAPLPKPVLVQQPSEVTNAAHFGRRVSVSGRLVMRQWDGRYGEWALFRPKQHEAFRLTLSPTIPRHEWERFQFDSTIEATGVLRVLPGKDGIPAGSWVLVSQPDDLKLLEGPPLPATTVKWLAGGSILAILALAAVGVRSWHGMRLARVQNVQLARENQLQQRFALVAETASDQILTLDFQGRLTFINPVGERLLTAAGEDLRGLPYARWIEAPYQDAWKNAVAAASQGAEPKPFEIRIRDIQGIGTEVEVVLRRLNDHELQCIGRDLTEARRAQRELARQGQQKRELEEQLRRSETLRALGTLAGGVAHDFNNLLASILGNAELSQSDLPTAHPVRENNREIITAAKRGADLVRRILSFSRPQAPHKTPILLSEVVRESATVISKAMPPGTRLHWQVDVGELPVLGDATQLNQVLVNLCVNAAHALEGKGGEVEIGITTTTVSAEMAATRPPLKAGPAVRLTVRDTGCGMTPEILARVFEPFFTTKEPGRGTGLGLAITHSVVQAHEGCITLESTPGVGTRVDIMLPTQQPTATAPGEAVHSPGWQTQGRNESVLVVDDDPSVLRFAGRALERLGYNVTTLASPTAAFERLRSDPTRFQLLLTDLSMPEQSGADLALAVHKLFPDLPIIIATGYGPSAAEQLARTGNRFPVLSKPFDMFELGQLIRRKLDRQ